MKGHNRLRDLLINTRPHRDRDGTRPAVRSAFAKALRCQTPELGAEVFASEHEEQVFCHTCKSRPCSSCGYRATVRWQREWWAALPDVPYKGITFTMPDVLWPLFHDNPHLTEALSALAAKIIQTRVSIRSSLRVGVMAILHTFNGKLEFNSHVHTMVTAGGLYGLSDSWVRTVYYDRAALLESWRTAVIKLLRTALRVGQLVSALTVDELEVLLGEQETRWWSVNIKSFKSKDHFLRYAGRYIRRPPIAQRRVSLWDGESSDFGTETRRYVVGLMCSALRKSSWNAGVSIFQSDIGTRSGALACSLRAPCRRPSTLSSPSWDRSVGHVLGLDAGRNQSSEISDGTHCWTRRASE